MKKSPLIFAVLLGCATLPPIALDPGVRDGAPGAGDPLPGLTDAELAFFKNGMVAFITEGNTVEDGLGARFNSDTCASCHSQPATGGTSPRINPQIAAASARGAKNSIPFFINFNSPVREARFKRKPDGTPDGGVHDLFTITGRDDAGMCFILQPDFAKAAAENNLIFRIPSPVFGAGLIEAIPDKAILANVDKERSARNAMGIYGRPNRQSLGRTNTSGNDGTVTRFGWKAQNKSLEIFSGEAYNVEMGVTNHLFPTEREETASCLLNPTPEDTFRFDAADPIDVMSDVERFAIFMRFLTPPMPAPVTPQIIAGSQIFVSTGCALCHTPMLKTGENVSAALSKKNVNLFSDLLLHNMGVKLADDIVQGAAQGDEFRTAPLWGLGQRLFFLHDGRTSNLVEAIEAHKSRGSEANKVIRNFNRLSVEEQKNMILFLRSL